MDKQTDRQTNKQTGQKQYAPDHSIQGHKNIDGCMVLLLDQESYSRNSNSLPD